MAINIDTLLAQLAKTLDTTPDQLGDAIARHVAGDASPLAQAQDELAQVAPQSDAVDGDAALGELALDGDFAHTYWDLRASGFDARHAFAYSWWQVYQTNPAILRAAGLPKNKTQLAAKIGVSRRTVHKWFGSKEFRDTGLPGLIDAAMPRLVAKAMARLERNIEHSNAHVANTAIKTTLDYHRSKDDAFAQQQAVQVNIDNKGVSSVEMQRARERASNWEQDRFGLIEGESGDNG